MSPYTIRRVVNTTKPPVNIYTSAGRIVYVDHPEAVVVTKQLIAIGLGMDIPRGVAKDFMLLAPEHIVRIEHTKRRPLRKVA